jgi:sugar/nucleoside kinase (ribokinase family)
VKRHLHFDYTTIGHVTVDVLPDGSRRPGGAAFYSALQAARLGLRTLIVTRGVEREIEALLEPYLGELELRVLPATRTTTLETLQSALDADADDGASAEAARRQRMLAWAGPIAQDVLVETAILHLAPIARESPSRWRGAAAFVGLTPQGLVREWSGADAEVRICEATPAAAGVARRCDAIVVSELEADGCAGLIAAASAAGAVVAVTSGARPNTILTPGSAPIELNVPAIDRVLDDLGAGDVFAAAFFVELSDGCLPAQAAAFANAAAAVRLGGAGAGAIGSRAEIEARLSRVALGR